LRSKDSRAVWRGAVGKVLIRVTRWQPTLPQARFLGEGDGSNAIPLPGESNPSARTMAGQYPERLLR
jgi:hypothetical protein